MRILCATDLLPKTEAAVERAGMLAGRLAADLSLLHVVVPAESERALEQDLQRAIAQVRSRSKPPLWQHGKTPNVIVKTGRPDNHIVATIAEIGARLAVLGPHRRRAAKDALSGTIAGKVLSSRTAPVLIVRRAPRAAYRNVLLALDLSEISALAVRAAESLVLSADAHAVIVHAYEPRYQGMLSYAGVNAEAVADYRRSWAGDAQTRVRDLLERESCASARYDIVLKQARPAAAILDAAERLRPDLLVMGTRGHGRLRRALLGSVANRVLDAAGCDLLVVPDGSVRVPRPRISGAGHACSRSTRDAREPPRLPGA